MRPSWFDVISQLIIDLSEKGLRIGKMSTTCIYSIPLGCLSFFYIRIIYFIRQQSNNVTFIVKRRQDRDLLAIRRILAHFSLLCTLGLSSVIFLGISLIIDGIPHPLVYRVLWVGVEISIATLCVIMLVMTSQLKQIVM
jgi:hypothetical protein